MSKNPYYKYLLKYKLLTHKNAEDIYYFVLSLLEKDTVYWKKLFRVTQSHAVVAEAVKRVWIVAYWPHQKQGSRQ